MDNALDVGIFGGGVGVGNAELDERKQMNVLRLQNFEECLAFGFVEARKTFLDEGGWLRAGRNVVAGLGGQGIGVRVGRS